jgi:hypothetical protein
LSKLIGPEPLAITMSIAPFGFVDCCSISVTPIAPNDLRRFQKLGYSYGYRGNCRELSTTDVERLEMTEWLAGVWPILPASLRVQLKSLVENALIEMSEPPTESEAITHLVQSCHRNLKNGA